MDDLNSLTVSELKELLRNKGKKVSGRKKELILRLMEEEETYLSIDDESTPIVRTKSTPTPKNKILCTHCSQMLNIPEGYQGKVECPKCKRSFNRIPLEGSQLGTTTMLLLSLTAVAFLVAIVSLLIVLNIDDNGSPYGYGYGVAIFTLGSAAVGCILGLLSFSSYVVDISRAKT